MRYNATDALSETINIATEIRPRPAPSPPHERRDCGMKVSPRYITTLVPKIEKAIWDEFSSYRNVEAYINRWHETDSFGNWENFDIITKDDGNIDLLKTL